MVALGCGISQSCAFAERHGNIFKLPLTVGNTCSAHGADPRIVRDIGRGCEFVLLTFRMQCANQCYTMHQHQELVQLESNVSPSIQ